MESGFSGERAALFGGLEYSFLKKGLNIKLEYDTSNIDNGPVEVKSKFNLGFSRPLGEFIDLGLSFEKGTQVRFTFVIKGNYAKKV